MKQFVLILFPVIRHGESVLFKNYLFKMYTELCPDDVKKYIYGGSDFS